MSRFPGGIQLGWAAGGQYMLINGPDAAEWSSDAVPSGLKPSLSTQPAWPLSCASKRLLG